MGDIENISTSLKHLKNLVKFDIASNRISDIKELKYLNEKVEEIYLGANKINEFNVDLTHLKNLKILDLKFNKLSEIDLNLIPKSVHTLLLNNNPQLKVIKNNDREFKILDCNDTEIAVKKINQ